MSLCFAGDSIPQKMKNFSHYDTSLFCLTASQILYAYIFAPFSLPASYMQFLMRAGQKDKRVLGALTSVATGVSMSRPAVESYCIQHGIDHTQVLDLPFTPGGVNSLQKDHLCHLMHPGESCAKHYVKFTLQHAFSIGIPLYVPVTMVSMLIWHRKKVFDNPVETLKRIIKSSVRSALFLAMYCGNAWAMQCLLRYFNILSPKSVWFFIGLAAGLPILLEDKARRLELAIYCASPALQSLYTCGIRYNYMPRVPNVRYWRQATQYHVMALFVWSMGVIMSAHQKDKGHLQPTFSQILKNLMGLN